MAATVRLKPDTTGTPNPERGTKDERQSGESQTLPGRRRRMTDVEPRTPNAERRTRNEGRRTVWLKPDTTGTTKTNERRTTVWLKPDISNDEGRTNDDDGLAEARHYRDDEDE
jgi:hypothetical protein